MRPLSEELPTWKQSASNGVGSQATPDTRWNLGVSSHETPALPQSPLRRVKPFAA